MRRAVLALFLTYIRQIGTRYSFLWISGPEVNKNIFIYKSPGYFPLQHKHYPSPLYFHFIATLYISLPSQYSPLAAMKTTLSLLAMLSVIVSTGFGAAVPSAPEAVAATEKRNSCYTDGCPGFTIGDYYIGVCAPKFFF